MIHKNKRAAIEMTMGTLVTIVLLTMVLILGGVLISNIFSSAKYNVDSIDQKLRGEINKLFTEDQKIVIYLPNQEADINQGGSWGVAWAVKNTKTGTDQASKFTYEVVAVEANNCGSLTTDKATSFIVAGQKDDSGSNILPGESADQITRINIPKDSPLCTIRYNINTKLDGQDYVSSFFDVAIK